MENIDYRKVYIDMHIYLFQEIEKLKRLNTISDRLSTFEEVLREMKDFKNKHNPDLLNPILK